jgi:hypothetical protein
MIFTSLVKLTTGYSFPPFPHKYNKIEFLPAHREARAARSGMDARRPTLNRMMAFLSKVHHTPDDARS